MAKAASEDQESLESRLNLMSEMTRDIKAKFIAKESELDVVSEDLRCLRAEHGTTRTDAEGMLKGEFCLCVLTIQCATSEVWRAVLIEKINFVFFFPVLFSFFFSSSFLF